MISVGESGSLGRTARAAGFWTNCASVVTRSFVFALIWWILTDGNSQSWWIGAPAVLLAALASTALVPPFKLVWNEVMRFVPFFLWRSMIGGADVAWRTLHPRLPIAPDIIDYPLRLPFGLPQIIMANTVSLLPGTLSADLHDHCLSVHVLTRRQGLDSEIAAVEATVARLFGIILRQRREMIPMQRFKNIVCVVEPDADAEITIERAAALAYRNQARLTVVTVIPRITGGRRRRLKGNLTVEEVEAAIVRERQQQLDLMTQAYGGRLELETKVLVGTGFLRVIREVLAHNRDLLVKLVGTTDWAGRLFGSDDMHLLRKCPCPVWLIRRDATKSYQRILAAVDMDDNYAPEELEVRQALNREILELAYSLALAESAQLQIVSAWDAVYENALRSAFVGASEQEIDVYLEETRQQYAQNLDAVLAEVSGAINGERLGLQPDVRLVKGPARKQIPAIAKSLHTDLVVMGTVGRVGIPGFFVGNTAEAILDQIECSVLAVKPPGFVSPVTRDG